MFAYRAIYKNWNKTENCQPTIEYGVVQLIGWENLFGINGLILIKKISMNRLVQGNPATVLPAKSDSDVMSCLQYC